MELYAAGLQELDGAWYGTVAAGCVPARARRWHGRPRQREIRRRNERHARRLAVQRWCIAFLYVLDMAVAVTAVVAFAEGAISQSGLARSLLHANGFAILIDWAHLRDERRAERGRKALRYAVAAS